MYFKCIFRLHTAKCIVELIEFPVGLIAGVILSSVVVALIAVKLVCVVTIRCRRHRALAAGDIASDTDEQRDMLSAATDEQPCNVDVADEEIPATSCGKRSFPVPTRLHPHHTSNCFHGLRTVDGS